MPIIFMKNSAMQVFALLTDRPVRARTPVAILPSLPNFRPLWCLRDKSFIQRTDNDRFSITAARVEAYEEIENEMPEGPQ